MYISYDLMLVDDIRHPHVITCRVQVMLSTSADNHYILYAQIICVHLNLKLIHVNNV